MQAPPTSQRSTQRRSPAADPGPPPSNPPPNATSTSSASQDTFRNSSSSARSSSSNSRRLNPSQQLSQIEKSVTHLLVATKQLLETLTQWSRHAANEAEVSDVYVRLGYEFNIACRAFTAIGVETADLGNVPDLLRTILEDTLSQDASPASLDKYLPRIRDIIINLLHGLKRKQQKLRQKQGRDGVSPNGVSSRVGSGGTVSTNGQNTSEDVPPRNSSNGVNAQAVGRSRSSENGTWHEDPGIPPRVSSVAGRASPIRQDSLPPTSADKTRLSSSNRENQESPQRSSSSMSTNTMQNTPVIPPQHPEEPILPRIDYPPENISSYPPPPPPPKQQDAFAALQRGGDLERRASRRYSAYQIQKHLGASPHNLPMLPPSQNSPIPNRGRETRESMNAVRIRRSVHTRQKSANPSSPKPLAEESINITGQVDQLDGPITIQPPQELPPNDSPVAKTPEDKIRSTDFEAELAGHVVMPPSNLPNPPTEEPKVMVNLADNEMTTPQKSPNREAYAIHSGQSTASTPPPFAREDSPQSSQELVLFLQYKSKIKKFVLPDRSGLSNARLQLAFIEKFAWNTHSNGNDLPEIYVQDPVSGVRHELEDLSDVRDRSVLVLNVEVLDEVKKHIDEGFSGLRRMVEGVRNVVDGQQTALERVSSRQTEAAKELARFATTPSAVSKRVSQIDRPATNGIRSPISPVDNAAQRNEIQSLRQDLAVMRQTYSSFVADVQASMAAVRAKASAVKIVAVTAALPKLEADAGRAYVNSGKKTLGEDSEQLVGRVDDLQDSVEDLRKDVVTRGVRPLPRQLETVGKDIAQAMSELKKMQEFIKREKPKWSKIWESQLEQVCNDQNDLTMQEELAADLEVDLEGAAATFALVEQATKQQLNDTQDGAPPRSVSRGFNNIVVDPRVDLNSVIGGVLGEVLALRPNHETRVEAITRAEKARKKELASRTGGAFQKELGSFVEQGKLKKSGGVGEVDRQRKAKDERIRVEVWERQNAREKAKEAKAKETAVQNSKPLTELLAQQDLHVSKLPDSGLV
ncbi:MAG: Bud site selection protein 6 [Trizodia sp. TS-e1964]|nr:MAG: Bud site selection protein 6 [Trizodia sp. TS-e1964]